jgi:hypothetical protein
MSANPFLGNPFFSVSPFDHDPFDSVLHMRCSVWKKVTTSETGYGQPIERFEMLVDDVPCFVEQQSGKELNVPPAPASETSLGIATYLVFLRPLSVDVPAVPLNNHHFLQVRRPDDWTLDPNDPNSGAVMYNITDVDNPGMLDHHYEVMATVIKP